MKSNLLLGTIFLILISFGISSCSSNSTAGGQVNPNAVGTPFTLKYEIITSSPAVSNPASQGIGYTNGTQQTEFDNSFTSGSSWIKEINVTSTTRPFNTALVSGPGSITLSAPGTVTGNIYINGNQVAHVVNPTNGNIGNVVMGYSVN